MESTFVIPYVMYEPIADHIGSKPLRLHFNVELAEGGVFVSVCQEIRGIILQAKTLDQLIKQIPKSVDALFITFPDELKKIAGSDLDEKYFATMMRKHDAQVIKGIKRLKRSFKIKSLEWDGQILKAGKIYEIKTVDGKETKHLIGTDRLAKIRLLGFKKERGMKEWSYACEEIGQKYKGCHSGLMHAYCKNVLEWKIVFKEIDE